MADARVPVRILLSFAFTALLAAPLHAQTRRDGPAQAGWQALQAGDADRAAAIFREAISANPSDPVLHLGAGIAAFVGGREHDAAESLRRALQLEPRLTAASELLGEIQYRDGDIDQAIRTYEEALGYAPANPGMQSRLENWKKEAALHQTLQQRNDGRFSIVFEGKSDQALATRAIEVLDAAYWRIGRALGAYPPDTIVVTLYTEQQFRDLTHAPDWSEGLFDGRIRLPVRGASQNLQQFDRMLSHELTHAMVSSLAPRGVPAWVQEGLATYFEPQDPAVAVRLLKAVPTVPLSNLPVTFLQLSGPQAAYAYSMSLVAASVLLERVGDRTSILLQALGSGQSVDQAFDGVGASYVDFQAEVTRRVR